MSDSTLQVDRLIGQLRGDGSADPGHFTVERKRARELANRHLLERRREYILFLVRAAVRRGAPDVRITIRPDRVSLVFAGQPFRRRELERRDDAVIAPLGGAGSPGLRELGLALIAAGRLGFELVQISSGAGTAAVDLQLRHNRPEELVRVQRSSAVTRIQLVGVGMGDALKRGTRVEQKLLERRCRYSALPILLNGCPISDPEAFSGVTAATVEHVEEGLRARAGFRPQRAMPAELRFTMDDVWVATEPLDVDAEGFVAYVQVDGLRLDLSQSKVIQDAAYDRAVAAVEGLLVDAQRLNSERSESKELVKRYQLTRERMDGIVQGYTSRRLLLGGLGICLVLLTAVVSLSMAIWVSPLGAFFSGCAGLLLFGVAQQYMWNNNDDRFKLKLRVAFRPDTGNQHLAAVAFRKREYEKNYQQFRTLFVDFLKHNAEASKAE